MHWIYLIHEFHNLSWITEINELFHDILIYWDALVYVYDWMTEWMNEWCIYIALYCVLYTQSALQSYIYIWGMAGRWNGWSFLLIPFPAILWVCFPLLHFNCYWCTRHMCLTCAIAFCFVSVFDYGCLLEKKSTSTFLILIQFKVVLLLLLLKYVFGQILVR